MQLKPTSLRAFRPSRRTATFAALAAAVATAAVVALAASAPAQATVCFANTAWTAITASNSDNFAIAGSTDCNDLNAAYTYSNNDYIRGWYRDGGGTWHAGSAGYVYVDTSDNGWIVLLTSVADGTVVRGQGLNYAQNVRYVT